MLKVKVPEESKQRSYLAIRKTIKRLKKHISRIEKMADFEIQPDQTICMKYSKEKYEAIQERIKDDLSGLDLAFQIAQADVLTIQIDDQKSNEIFNDFSVHS